MSIKIAPSRFRTLLSLFILSGIALLSLDKKKLERLNVYVTKASEDTPEVYQDFRNSSSENEMANHTLVFNNITNLINQSISLNDTDQILWIPELSEPPIVGRDYVSEDKTWRWVYPRNKTKADFVNQSLFPEEVSQSCSGYCCFGGSGGGGGSLKPNLECQKRFDFMAEFQPNSKLIYSLVDGIELWKLSHPESSSLRILMIGDSVQGQVFFGSICDLLRTSRTMNVSIQISKKNIKHADFRLSFEGIEAQIYLIGSTLPVYISFIREYRPYPDRNVLETIFSKYDIIILGWGLHYSSRSFSEFSSHLSLVFNALNETHSLQKHNHPPLIIWLGDLFRK